MSGRQRLIPGTITGRALSTPGAEGCTNRDARIDRRDPHLAIAFCCGVAANLTARDQVDAISSALRARDYDRAVELTRDALKATPNDAQIWTLQGIALSRKGTTAGALEAYRRALTLSPDYIPALEGAAQLHYQAGSRDAVPLLTRLLRLRPGDPTSHAMLAGLESREGNCRGAG